MVEAGVSAEVGGRSFRGDGPAGDSGHGWSVVGPRLESGVGRVEFVRYEGDLGEDPGVLEVAVGDVPFRVISRY